MPLAPNFIAVCTAFFMARRGKGANEDWVCVVRPGRVLYELEGVDEALAKAAFHLADHKLPVGTKVVSREPVL